MKQLKRDQNGEEQKHEFYFSFVWHFLHLKQNRKLLKKVQFTKNLNKIW